MTHRLHLRIYYEDTDLAGIVYYANYLKYIERGRSEWLRALGVDQTALKGAGVVFAVRRVEADYLIPAKFEDDLVVETSVLSVGGARLDLAQDVMRGDDRLFSARVTIVALTDTGKPTRLPADVRRLLAGNHAV